MFQNTILCRSRKENPQKLTQLSSRSHPRHLVGKRTAQKDTIIDITSHSQVNRSVNVNVLCMALLLSLHLCVVLVCLLSKLFSSGLSCCFSPSFFCNQLILCDSVSWITKHNPSKTPEQEISKTSFLLCYSMNYRDFSVKSKLIISLFQTVKLSL